MAQVRPNLLSGTLMSFLDDAALNKFAELENVGEVDELETLKEMFHRCFTPVALETQLRYQFNQKKQGSGETFESFRASLKECARKAYAGTETVRNPVLFDQLVRDQFINGVTDPYVTEQLLIFGPETLEDAVRQATKIQLARQGAKKEGVGRVNQVSEDAGDGILSINKRIDELQSKLAEVLKIVSSKRESGAETTGQSAQYRRGTGQQGPQCYRCHQYGHMKRDCQAPLNSRT